MKKLDLNRMEIVKDYANKADNLQGQDVAGNCYECDSEGCDGGPCDCDDGGYQD